jgi:hypothetical protein
VSPSPSSSPAPSPHSTPGRNLTTAALPRKRFRQQLAPHQGPPAHFAAYRRSAHRYLLSLHGGSAAGSLRVAPHRRQSVLALVNQVHRAVAASIAARATHPAGAVPPGRGRGRYVTQKGASTVAPSARARCAGESHRFLNARAHDLSVLPDQCCRSGISGLFLLLVDTGTRPRVKNTSVAYASRAGLMLTEMSTLRRSEEVSW